MRGLSAPSKLYDMNKWRFAGANQTSMVIIGINMVVFLALTALGGSSGYFGKLLALSTWGRCYASGDTFYPAITSPQLCSSMGYWIPGVLDGAPWQVITSAFVHFSILHIGFNMLALLFLGPTLEQVYGRTRFLIIYFGSAVTGSLFVILLAGRGAITFGASGAIFGIMGALLAFLVATKQNPQELLIWLGINAVISFTGPNISWQGHLGGFIGGLLIGLLMFRLYQQKQRRRIRHFQPPYQP